LTIIFELGNEFWIETFHILRANIGAGGNRVTNTTLERAGFFLGGGVCIDTATFDTTVLATQNATMQQLDDTELIVGTRITGVRTRESNDDAGVVLRGLNVFILMRGVAK